MNYPHFYGLMKIYYEDLADGKYTPGSDLVTSLEILKIL
jgi:hypothetical protein